MEPLPPEHSEPEIDALLRGHRPLADPAWVATLEARLLERRPATRLVVRWPSSPVRAGAVVAVLLAFALVVLSLAGAGPLGVGDEHVVAEDECRTVSVTRTERVPRLVESPGSEPRIVYERRRVQRAERRCR